MTDPQGVHMEAQLIPPHLNCIKNKHTRLENQSDPISQVQLASDSGNDLAGHLFVLTLTDDGPHPHSSASKLWNSCAKF